MPDNISDRIKYFSKVKIRTDSLGMVNYYKKYDAILRLHYVFNDDKLLSHHLHDSSRENIYSGISHCGRYYSLSGDWELSNVSKSVENTEALDEINLPKPYQLSSLKHFLYAMMPLTALLLLWFLIGPVTAIFSYVVLTFISHFITRKALRNDLNRKVAKMDRDYEKNKLILETDKAYKEGKMVDEIHMPSKYSLYDTERMIAEL